MTTHRTMRRSRSAISRAVRAGSATVELLELRWLLTAPQPLLINGSPNNDVISLTVSGSTLTATMNGSVIAQRDLAQISSISVFGGDGYDRILLDAGVPSASLYGGNAGDTL